VLIWASLRFGPRGATTATLLVATIAIWATVRGAGPFARPHLRDSLFTLQTYLGIVGATFLVLSASFAERKQAEVEARLAETRAEEANRAKAEFLAVMSHELRTPLNAISGYVQLLLMEVQGPITAQQRDALGRIHKSERHLLSLIEDVLTFATEQAARLSLQLEAVNVRDVIDSVDPFIEDELRRKELTLIREPGDAAIMTRADPERLRQILLNLLSNAAKYTDPGGRITIGVERTRDDVRISVADTGIGIPEDQLARVFEPFFQVDQGTKRRFQGIGLGLSIARDLARAMGGDIALTSRLGVGTTVTVSLSAVSDG
jgi:signal transduction histidine kinase